MKSIKFKLAVLFLTMVFFVMIISGIFIRMSLQTQESTRAYEELMQFARIIDEEIIQVYRTPQEISVALNTHIHAQIMASRRDIQASVLFSDGTPINPDAIGDYTSSVIISAMVGNTAFNPWERARDLREEEDRVSTWMTFATPASTSEYIIYLRMNAALLQENLDNTTYTIVLSVLLAMVLATVLATLFARTLTGPISKLAKMAKEIAEGDIQQQIPVYSDDEIGQLTENFNDMSRSLHATMEKMSSDKNRVEIIIHSMTDGLIAFDKIGDLIHANQAALELLSIKEDYFIDINYINDIFGEDFKNEDIVIEIEDKFVNASFNTYDNAQGELDGIVIVLQDVTKHTKLDNMRKEFVANVSHEIRTPLTVIKTYAETLIDSDLDDKEMARDFLNTINSEVDRMTLLATDLLELSHFDNKQLSMTMGEHNLLQILTNSIKQTTVLAEKKEQTIVFVNETGDCLINCDEGRINQVFVNLLSNAVKYSEPKTTIEVSLKQNKKFYEVYIKDNGIGIAKKDLERIFERFYRTDKARSRAMGGVGLGLSIVKEILDLHNAKIDIISGIGKGTTAIIKFVS